MLLHYSHSISIPKISEQTKHKEKERRAVVVKVVNNRVRTKNFSDVVDSALPRQGRFGGPSAVDASVALLDGHGRSGDGNEEAHEEPAAGAQFALVSAQSGS